MGHRVTHLSVSQIFPAAYQPRQYFDEDELRGLSESIVQNGMLQPISVRRVPGGYQVVAGERRLRAAKMAGFKRVPCIVLLVDDQKASLLALLENIQRHDLNYFEEAEALATLLEEEDLTQEELSEKLGKSQSAIANKVRLLRIPPPERWQMLENGLTERHARALLRVTDQAQRKRVLTTIIAKKYNVAETEHYIEQILSPPVAHTRQSMAIIKDLRLFVNTVNRAVDTMRRSGIEAEANHQETEQYIEYTVRIRKQPLERRSAG